MNFAHVFQKGDPVLIAVFLLLVGMSVASWYIIFWKSWKLRKERQLLAKFNQQYMGTPDWPKHSEFKQISGSLAVLVNEIEALKPVVPAYNLAARKELLSMHLSQRLDLVRTWLDKGLVVLASVGSSAPFIGLFGTVWGIYGALTKIAAEGNAGLNVVAGPMGEALVATAIGLFAAIPAVLAYNAFVRQNRLLVQDFRHIAEQMTAYLSFSLVPNDQSQSENVTFLRGGR